MRKETAETFHGYYDGRILPYYQERPNARTKVLGKRHTRTITRSLKYQFYLHQHPYAPELMNTLLRRSVKGLQAVDTDYVTNPDGSAVMLDAKRKRPKLYAEFFDKTYAPSALVTAPYPVRELDFTPSAAYGVYNWELFYHIPFTIAVNLSRNQRFAESQRWFHYIFDPTDDSTAPSPERFWKVRPFHYVEVRKIEDVLINLSTGQDADLWQETFNSIAAWRDAPFRPHVVARYRQSAYMLKTVMAYLDNLVQWGDSLFRQDTRETINEATQLYVLAANILGPRPQAVPSKGSVRTQSYNDLRPDLDAFSNALRDVEADIPFDLAPHPPEVSDNAPRATIQSIGRSLYFAVPRNDKLLGYWDTVADRLFKIHNSLNIQGVFRQLALFEPPIDPALLARAAAAGVDIGATISGTNQPLPLVRFRMLIQKASEVCQEVKSLGSNLLAAMEKEDNEALSILRAKHERVILQLAETVKFEQLQEAIKTEESLFESLNNTFERFKHYEKLLGTDAQKIQQPQFLPLDTASLEKMKFKSDEPSVKPIDIAVDIQQGVEGITGGKKISSFEFHQAQKLGDAQTAQDAAVVVEAIGAVINLIPMFSGDVKPIGCGAGAQFGGSALGAMFSGLAQVSRGVAGRFTYDANKAGTTGGWDRREQDWSYQRNLAAGEMTQTYKQLRAAEIRTAIAEREWSNHKQQIRNAEDIERFLTDERTGKKTNQGLYAWMKREVKGLYAQAFQFAFEVAKKAERALQHELGNDDLSFLKFGYLAGKEGLLAADKLYFDVKRMEMAYHELNQREYEIAKHISLAQVDPRALLELRAAGRCTVSIPEEIFDFDGPGQYFRRLRRVAVSIPSVAGPHTSVSCTLTLLRSRIRKSPLLQGGGYAQESDDLRFSEHFGSLQAIVTSTAQNDAGVFDGRGDEFYQPFEYSGAISDWQLELPKNVRQFDYDTISDVILHFQYTAREGGDLLEKAATANLEKRIEEGTTAGSVRLLSMRHEFPTEWAKFKSVQVGPNGRAELSINLKPEHYPFWSAGRIKSIKNVMSFAKPLDDKAVQDIEVAYAADGTGNKDKMVKDPSLPGLRVAELKELMKLQPTPVPVGKVTLHLKTNALKDHWLAVAWGS
jgi:hypothetical protein